MSSSTPAPSFSTFFWFAVWAGITVACIYLCQPLLHAIGQELHLSDREASLVATATQVGYGVGIFTLVPLGDFFSRRRLIQVKCVLLAFATFACSLAHTLPLLAAASFMVGVFATIAQDIIPIAAELAPAAKRGRYLSYVMSGLILGILLSRTLAGLIAGLGSWRTVFVAGGGAVLFCLVTTFFSFPVLPERTDRRSIVGVYASMLGLLREQPLLRLSVLRHGLMGLAFSAFWTTLAFFLSKPPYEWSPPKIGMMGLAGAAGVLGSTLAGRLADERGPLFGIRVATVTAFVSFAAMGLFGSSTLVLVGGTVLFDLAIQMSLVSHQSIVYGLDPNARARLNGIFVSVLFLCFSLGSLCAGALWARWGWGAVMGMACIATAISFALTLVRVPRRAPVVG